ncbi:MAG: Sec-independent protein translocase subunit TatB [Burkholderiales bacterium]|nr:Sec-independent protein translocase subunit TatB [Burkholderiales bacterium]
MIDIGFSKLLILGGIALVVIGPERLPRVARMAGTLLGRAQRYVADVKAEVNRSIELEELSKVKRQFDAAAQDVHQSIVGAAQEAEAGLHPSWSPDSPDNGLGTPLPYRPPRKNWRLRRTAVPHWYKQRHGVHHHVQSGAARVARFRPPRRTSHL